MYKHVQIAKTVIKKKYFSVVYMRSYQHSGTFTETWMANPPSLVSL